MASVESQVQEKVDTAVLVKSAELFGRSMASFLETEMDYIGYLRDRPTRKIVVVDPEEEELVLQPVVKRHVRRPEHHLVANDGEAALEQVGDTLLEGNATQGLDGRLVVSAHISRPRLVSIVGASGILEGHGEPRGTTEGEERAEERLV